MSAKGIRTLSRRFVAKPLSRLRGRLRSWFLETDRHRRHEHDDRQEFLRKALVLLRFNGIPGDYVEFGSWGANTFSMVHRLLARYDYDLGPFHLWAFDSFQGLPASSRPEDEHPAWAEGALRTSVEEFHRLCRSRGVPREAYTVVPGFYEETLAPGAPGPRPSAIRLAYVDCDLYSSTKSVLAFLRPRLQHGMVLALDDYFCFSASRPSGERVALAEAFDGDPDWRLLPYLPFGWHGMSFVVEATRT